MSYFVYNQRIERACSDMACFACTYEAHDWMEWSAFSTLIRNLATAGALERAYKLGATPWSWYPGCGLESVW